MIGAPPPRHIENKSYCKKCANNSVISIGSQRWLADAQSFPFRVPRCAARPCSQQIELCSPHSCLFRHSDAIRRVSAKGSSPTAPSRLRNRSPVRSATAFTSARREGAPAVPPFGKRLERANSGSRDRRWGCQDAFKQSVGSGFPASAIL